MSGIYLHIPFCKKKCNYCNFHFSTNRKNQNEMISALAKELEMRKDEVKEPVQTIYFGGGTPSLLEKQEILFLLNLIYELFPITEKLEITLEANPDDLSRNKLQELKKAGITRLSIGIQSFYDIDLEFMNRSHTALQSLECIQNAQSLGFDNISIDLIYGSQTTSNAMWEDNLQQALDLNVPHISAYALTVEPKTILEYQIKQKNIPNVSEEKQFLHFKQLQKRLVKEEFIAYEISNFGKKGFFSQHNVNYWKRKTYLGVGPSAHSFQGKKRSWNVANNIKYIKSIQEQILPKTEENLSLDNLFNEEIMIGLRTIWGVDLDYIQKTFPPIYLKQLLNQSEYYLNKNQIIIEESYLKLDPSFRFLADGIAADLFRV